MKPIRSAFVLLYGIALIGCSSVFFFPDKEIRVTPAEVGVSFQEILISTEDEPDLIAWWIPASDQPPKGQVYYLHGNAENLSTHIFNVLWLAKQGYDILALDYRGYGKSSGTPDIPGALRDIDRGYQWFKHHRDTSKPAYLLGQSIGAALAASFAGNQKDLQANINAVVLDAGFESFRGIAREKLGEFWLTWPLQYPLSWIIPDQYDPVRVVDRISPTPILFIHSKEDIIVPFKDGVSLYRSAKQPKTLRQTTGGHTRTFLNPENRQALLDFFQSHAMD